MTCDRGLRSPPKLLVPPNEHAPCCVRLATIQFTKSNMKISRAQDSLPVTRTRSPYLQLRLGEATVIIIQVIETVFSFSRSSSSSSESFKSQLTQFFAADPRAGPPGDNRSLRVCGHSCRVCWVRGSPGARGGCRPRPFATSGYADLLDLRCALARDNTIKGLDMVLRKLGGHTPQTVTQLTARHLIWALST